MSPNTNQSSITDVARRAGCSVATVSRVMGGVPGKAGPAMVQRVQQAAAELGWRPAVAAQALRQGRGRLVAVLAPNLANPALAAIAASIEAALRAEGLATAICDTHDDPAIQDEHLREMRAHRVRAYVLLGAVASPGLARHLASGETTLFVNRRSPDGAARPFIGIDDQAAGADVAAHFLAANLPVAGVLHGPLGSSATAARVAAFRAALEAAGRPLEPAPLPPPGFTVEHVQIGYQGARALLQAGRLRPPCGLFCSSDLIAYGAHRALTEAGLRVPVDVAVIGFDDNPLNDWVAPWLSSVRVPYALFGPAVAAALQSLGSGAQINPAPLPHTLKLRASPPSAAQTPQGDRIAQATPHEARRLPKNRTQPPATPAAGATRPPPCTTSSTPAATSSSPAPWKKASSTPPSSPTASASPTSTAAISAPTSSAAARSATSTPCSSCR